MKEDSIYAEVIELMYINVVFNHLSGLTFGFIIYVSQFTFVCWLISVSYSPMSPSFAIESSLLIFLSLLMNVFSSYVTEKQGRENLNLKLKADKEIEQTELLLSNMVPEHVYEDMRKGVIQADKHSDVTVLYADISGFTA